MVETTVFSNADELWPYVMIVNGPLNPLLDIPTSPLNKNLRNE